LAGPVVQDVSKHYCNVAVCVVEDLKLLMRCNGGCRRTADELGIDQTVLAGIWCLPYSCCIFKSDFKLKV